MERDQQTAPAQTSTSNSSVPDSLIDSTNKIHTFQQQLNHADRFRTLAQTITDLLWITNNDGTAKETDPTWSTFTGQEDANFTGWRWLNIIHIDDQERIEELWKKALATQQYCEAECRIQRSDGIYRLCKIHVVPVRGANGNICEWIGIGIDITEHKQTEQRQILAEEAERLKDEFIGIAAHELRNPLTTLKGYTDALLTHIARGRGPELSAWQMKALHSINQATLRLVELSDDLLDVTRLQAGKLTLHMQPTDLIPLIKNVAARLQVTTEQHDIQVLTLLDRLIVNIDSRRMEQVLHNLIGNAIKYSPAGGPIIITLLQEGKTPCALLSIHDDGIGIPEQQQVHIFSRFMRADNVHAHGISGTGLGLYLCRELVERHGGHIWFGSSEGQGTTFFITLPISSDIPAES